MFNNFSMRQTLGDVPTQNQRLDRRQTPDRGAGLLEMSVVDNALNISLAEEARGAAMSPDELIIRGRRSLSNTTDPVPFLRTPTKNSISVVLRSSPRKRLSLGSLKKTLPLHEDPYSPTKSQYTKQYGSIEPTVKKLRLESDERPIAQLKNEVSLSTLLQGMSHKQLIDLIMAGVACDDPLQAQESEKRLRAQLPLPDVSELEKELLLAKRLIIKTLPTARIQSKTDAVAFGKALPYLSEFKNVMVSHIKRLHDSSNYDALIDYIITAWPCVVSTPEWETDCHNTTRRECFKLLICYCISAIKKGGMQLGSDRIELLGRCLRKWLKDYREVQPCLDTFKELLSND